VRDIAVTVFFAIAIPYCLVHAEFAISLWYWTSLFQPQTQTFSFAQNIPFGLLAGITTLVSWALAKGPKLPPKSPIVIIMVLLAAWTGVTTMNAIFFADAFDQWNLFLRPLTMVLVGTVVIRSRRELDLVIWAICIAIGYYGAKIGLFGLAGGLGKNWAGPSYMYGNNEVARGIIMYIPLLMYFFTHNSKAWVKAGIAIVILLSVVALVLSGSRGAWVAAIAMAGFAALRTKKALAWTLAACLIFAACVPFLPDPIIERFMTIQHYDTDGSFQGRVGAWQYALDKFPERPIMGGGFLVFDDEYKTSSHNSYVQALGEHGAIGLLLYVSLLVAAAATSISIRKRTAGHSELEWANHLAFMIQVSLLGYAVGSLTITAAFFPIFYAILGVLISLQVLVSRELEATKSETSNLSQKSLRWRAA